MSLVLGRAEGEALVITTPEGRTVRVAVTRARGGRASLGVDADPDVKVLRSELLADPPACWLEVTGAGSAGALADVVFRELGR